MSTVVDWMDEDPGTCTECGEPFELVRPGKSQPTCDCWRKCDHCGQKRVEYHGEPDPRWPNVSGYFCSDCGPFPDPEVV